MSRCLTSRKPYRLATRYCVNCGPSVGQCLDPFSSRCSYRGVVSRPLAAGLRQCDTAHWSAFHHISCHGCTATVSDEQLNTAARLIFSSSKFQHITPLLRQLHWLKAPVQIRWHSICIMQSSCTSVFTGLHLHTLPTSFVRWQMSRLISDFVPVHLRH